jgi:hypothetical protein
VADRFYECGYPGEVHGTSLITRRVGGDVRGGVEPRIRAGFGDIVGRIGDVRIGDAPLPRQYATARAYADRVRRAHACGARTIGTGHDEARVTALALRCSSRGDHLNTAARMCDARIALVEARGRTVNAVDIAEHALVVGIAARRIGRGIRRPTAHTVVTARYHAARDADDNGECSGRQEMREPHARTLARIARNAARHVPPNLASTTLVYPARTLVFAPETHVSAGKMRVPPARTLVLRRKTLFPPP